LIYLNVTLFAKKEKKKKKAKANKATDHFCNIGRNIKPCIKDLIQYFGSQN